MTEGKDGGGLGELGGVEWWSAQTETPLGQSVPDHPRPRNHLELLVLSFRHPTFVTGRWQGVFTAPPFITIT